MNHFFAYIDRMRYIERWALMRNSVRENIQEHSHQVAVLAHALAVIRNEKFGGHADAGAVAVAALDSGGINRSYTLYCNGVYTYYDDYRPKCTRHGHSGNIDVVTAIKWSCNIFFYDVGRRTTSDV